MSVVDVDELEQTDETGVPAPQEDEETGQENEDAAGDDDEEIQVDVERGAEGDEPEDDDWDAITLFLSPTGDLLPPLRQQTKEERADPIDAPLLALSDGEIAAAYWKTWRDGIVISNGRDMGCVLVEFYDGAAFRIHRGIGKTLPEALRDLEQARAEAAQDTLPDDYGRQHYVGFHQHDLERMGGIPAAFSGAAAGGAVDSGAPGDEWARLDWDAKPVRWHITEDGPVADYSGQRPRSGCNIVAVGAFLAVGGWLVAFIAITLLAAHVWGWK